MENDSAQHAIMGMRMYLENDYLNIYRGDEPYLDKPHFHFWLDALSFKFFGISHISYRIPGLIFTLLGAIACYGIAKFYYSKLSGLLAGVIFLSSQAIILSNHDLRTDAVLTGACAVSLWQLLKYVELRKLKNILIGAIFAAMAFSTKGYLGLMVIVVCLLVHIISQKKYKAILSWKVLVGLLIFILGIAPVLYVYYIQFDLNPNLEINGKTDVSGVRFILWDQVFDRYAGKGFSQNNTDYSFFFHTLLWAFFPWGLMVYYGFFENIKLWIKQSSKLTSNFEIFSSLGAIIVLIILNSSKSKLPHYINSLIPVLSILISGFLFRAHGVFSEHKKKVLVYLQLFIVTISTLMVNGLLIWSFPIINPLGYFLVYLALLFIIVFLILRNVNWQLKIVFISVTLTSLINISLNYQFYPNLLKFQAGNNAVEYITNNNLKLKNVYRLKGDKESFSFHFYSKRISSAIDIKAIKSEKYFFVFEEKLKELENHFDLKKIKSFDQFRITQLSFNFLNPVERTEVLSKAYLVEIKKKL